MNWKSEIEVTPSRVQIGIGDRTHCMGSCFAEHIGDFLIRNKFPTLLNPTGIVFNPISISNSIQRILDNQFPGEDEIFQNQGLYHHFEFHGSFSHHKIEVLLDRTAQSISEASNQIRQIDHLILTFGTAFGYKHKATGKIVANCHKVPSREFDRVFFGPDDLFKNMSETLRKLLTINPDLQIICTVSPVRHWRDGAVSNSRSKASLHLLIDQLEKEFEDRVYYFPSFELLIDELRDYRYYNEDLFHPSSMAVNFILEKFKVACLEERSRELVDALLPIQKGMAHRVMYPGSQSHQTFLKNQMDKTLEIESRFKEVDLSAERVHFLSQLVDS